MNSQSKQANWANHIGPYAAAGGGAFALGALINELRRQHASEKSRDRQELPENALVIDIPRTAPQSGNQAFFKHAEGVVDHTLSALIGLPVGFAGTKMMYDHVKQRQSDKEIADANRKYLQVLQSLHQKSAEVNTPLVDAFCKAAAEHMEKGGGVERALKWAPWGAAGAGTAALGADVARRMVGKPQPGTIGNALSTVQKGWITAALLASLGTAGAMVNASNKREAGKGPTIPSAVALNYEDLPPAAALQQPAPQEQPGPQL